MKRLTTRAIQLSLLTCLVAAGAIAQKDSKLTPTADKYLISASAGRVNHTEGLVSVAKPDRIGGMLIRGDQLQPGERVQTSDDGKAEILLNPGSYVRLGGGAEFEFQNTSLDDLRIKLLKGSAMLEVFATNEFRVSIFTPKSRVTIVDSGVYRFDLNAAGDGLLSVVEGRAVIGEKFIGVVKRGETGTLNGRNVTVAKFDREKRDDLAEWSRSRSKDLAKTASSLRNGNVGDALGNAFASSAWRNLGNSGFGVWIFDPRYGRFCFLPYDSYFRSPYGWEYGSWIYWYHYPPYIQPWVPRPKHIQQLSGPALGNLDGGKNGRDRGSVNYDPPSSKGADRSIQMPVYSPPPPVVVVPLTGTGKDRPINP